MVEIKRRTRFIVRKLLEQDRLLIRVAENPRSHIAGKPRIKPL
jgi:hypothetical protein